MNVSNKSFKMNSESVSPNSPRTKRKWTPSRLLILSVCLAIVVIILRWVIISMFIRRLVESKIKLQPGTDVWNIWKTVPLPVFSKFYFFNVTNPEQVASGAKPKLKQMGPYVYQEKRNKIILDVNYQNITYRPKTTFIFREDLSIGKQHDNVTILNVPFVGVTKVAWDLSKESFVLSTLDDMMTEKGEKLFHTNPVKDYLFDGISIDSFMDLLSLPVAQAFGKSFKIPEKLADGDFAFYDDRNATADKKWTIETGLNDVSKIGRILSYNNEEKLTIWNSKKCNEIRGTDGTIFPPFADRSRKLSVFVPDICRSIDLTYDSDGEFMEIPTLRFTISDKTFQNLSQNPENEGFCKNNYAWCQRGGVMPISSCWGGAPLYFSLPHFAGAPEQYAKNVQGLIRHQSYKSYVHVEPNIGLPIKANLKIQMNLELQKYEAMETFIDVAELMFPIVWIELTAEITPELAAPLRILVKVLHVTDVLVWMMLVFCLFGALAGLIWGYMGKGFRCSVC